MPKKSGSNRAAIKRRRELVKRHAVQGRSLPEIAALEGVSESTVERDLSAIAEENLRQVRLIEAERVGAELLAQWEVIRRELWGLHRAATNEAVKLGALSVITREGERIVLLLKRLGLMHEAPQELLVEVRFLRLLRGMSVQEKEQLLQLDDAAFKVALEQRLGRGQVRALLGAGDEVTSSV